MSDSETVPEDPKKTKEDDDDYIYDGEDEKPAPAPEPQEGKSTAKYDMINLEGTNALLYSLFTQGDYNECKSLIGEMLEQFDHQGEYAIYVRGLIARHEGDLDEALTYFQRALQMSAKDPKYLVEIGRCLFLQGKHAEAVEILEKSLKKDPQNSKAYYWLARSLFHLKTDVFNTTEKARDLLLQAPMLKQSTELLTFLAELQEKLGNYATAIHAYSRALELEPENIQLFRKVGILHLKNNDEDNAFATFGKALAYEPTDFDCILGAGSIMQAHNDHDVALNKYRIAADKCEYSGELWSNIAICLYSKGKLAAAHSCLKKAAYLKPLDPQINYNLGLVHIAMNLFCSAMHYLKAAATLKKDDPDIIAGLAIVFSKTGDEANARRAYAKSTAIRPAPRTLVNYAVFEYNSGNREEAQRILKIYREVVLKEDIKINKNSEAHDTAARLDRLLRTTSTSSQPEQFA